MDKLATLFKHGDLYLPPNKVIKSAAFSTLLEALAIVPLVKKDTKEYKEKVTRESELIKEQAALEGFNEGAKKWAEQLAHLESEADKIKQNFEERLILIAIAIAKKVVGREIEDKEGAVAIVMSTLKSVTLHKRITVYVNKKDMDLMEDNKAKIKSIFEELEVFSFQERPDVEVGGCIVETEAGIVDGRLHVIWKAVETSFTNLLLKEKKEPEPAPESIDQVDSHEKDSIENDNEGDLPQDEAPKEGGNDAS